MRKAQLVQALIKSAKASKGSGKSGSARPKTASKESPLAKTAAGKSRRKTNGKSNGKTARKATPRKRASAPTAKKPAKSKAKTAPKSPSAVRRIRRAKAQRETRVDLAWKSRKVAAGARPIKDRVVLMVRDSYWLHAFWEFTRRSITRAQAAMAEHWHTARPMLQLMQVRGSAASNKTLRLIRQIEIHGGVNNWYIDVKNAPKSYRVAVGYLAANEKFFPLGSSNTVTTPRPDTSSSLDENWAAVAADSERVFALSGGYSTDDAEGELRELFEERLRRPMGSPLETRYGAGAARLVSKNNFHFDVDAEVIVYGTTNPDSYVTLAGEPVPLRADGTFTVRMAMPNRRQVVPIVANSADGVEQRTTILSIDRNTRCMEPIIRDPADA